VIAQQLGQPRIMLSASYSDRDDHKQAGGHMTLDDVLEGLATEQDPVAKPTFDA
jgi:hypothetical protein